MRNRLSWPCSILTCVVALLLVPAVSRGDGGATIGAAPPLALGAVESGGAHYIDFWRVQLYAGDVITFDADLSNYDGDMTFDLFDPSVNEYTVSGAEPAASTTRRESTKQQFTLTSPYTGLGTLAVCQTEGSACTTPEFKEHPFTFTATITHAVSLSVSAPILARRKSLVTVAAKVQSVAGTPEGACLIQGAPVPLTAGICSKRVRVGRGARQTIRVSFVPNDGWQEASAQRHIRLVR